MHLLSLSPAYVLGDLDLSLTRVVLGQHVVLSGVTLWIFLQSVPRASSPRSLSSHSGLGDVSLSMTAYASLGFVECSMQRALCGRLGRKAARIQLLVSDITFSIPC